MALNILWQAPNQRLLPQIQSTHTFVPYQDEQLAGQIGPSTFFSITCMPQHAQFSFEELRLNDYQHGRGVLTRTETNNSFAPEGNGLAFARVPPVPPLGLTWNGVCRTSAKDVIRLGADIITFSVGEETPQKFVIHENIIRPRSEFVRLALSKDWKEARERKFDLPNDWPDAFELYQHWLYANNIPSDSFGDTTKDAEEYELLVHSYILGEKMMDPHFKDAIIDSIIHKLCRSSFFDPRLTNIVYENTPVNSPLRRLWQDIYVWSGNPDWLDKSTLGDFIHAEFTLDLSRYQMNLNRGVGPTSAPYVGSLCTYHEHANGDCHRRTT
ncbi:hypothetical protein LTR37_008237 [Vermiconidia calcicola]|uniref:Uncharacterized protein n=1 Tax=Vermiconidia calcicola TaxID=1690605 RepID=A0ACC3NBE9_9PEZI|nr:hypothetical protein LTR37_008237 [Vermiconidia calcicola]